VSQVCLRTGGRRGVRSAPRGPDGRRPGSTATPSAPAPSYAPVAIGPHVHLLSVDLEPWAGRFRPDDALFLLDLFRRNGATATFFVLASVAREHPGLIRRIDAEGHEVASHGWTHRPLYDVTPDAFRKETAEAVALLADVLGKPVLGFRAPLFSVMPGTLWALDVLLDLGIQYDSSVFPFRGRRYGFPGFPRQAVRVSRGDRSIVEVPLSTVRRGGMTLPASGGGYFRLLPYALIRRALRAVNAEGRPLVVYCHPYEFGRRPLRCPRGYEGLGFWQRRLLETKANLFRSTMRPKLERLLDQFRFCSFQEALRDEITR